MRIVVEIERAAGAGQVVQLALRDRLGGPLLHEEFEHF